MSLKLIQYSVINLSLKKFCALKRIQGVDIYLKVLNYCVEINIIKLS